MRMFIICTPIMFCSYIVICFGEMIISPMLSLSLALTSRTLFTTKDDPVYIPDTRLDSATHAPVINVLLNWFVDLMNCPGMVGSNVSVV